MSTDLSDDIFDVTEDSPEVRQWVVNEKEHDQRLDKVLVSHVPEFSRSYLQNLIQQACVVIDGNTQTLASRRIRWGQTIQITLKATAESKAFTPEILPNALAILYEDEHLMILNKPVGLVVHPAPGNWSGTLLNALLAHHANAMMLPRAGIVHRLDKDTSGVMVVAKNLQAMNALASAIAQREVQRTYLALAHGMVKWQTQTVDAPIGRDRHVRTRMAVQAGGKLARTHFEQLALNNGYSALRCKLETGRTHQIRVHCAHMGHPLVADQLYGGKQGLGICRQALHAIELAFCHPITQESMLFKAPPPQDFQYAWDLVLSKNSLADPYQNHEFIRC